MSSNPAEVPQVSSIETVLEDVPGQDGSSMVRQELLTAAREGTLIPLIGPGLSSQRGIPNWRDLSKRLLELATDEKRPYIKGPEQSRMKSLLNRKKFRVLSDVLRYRLPVSIYQSLLVEIFNPPPPKEENLEELYAIHQQIFRLNPPIILTTNYDLLLEDAYAHAYGKMASVYTYSDIGAVRRAYAESRGDGRPIILKLHGSISDPSEMIMMETNYQQLSSGFSSFLANLFNYQNILIIGFSLSDRELISVMQTICEKLEYKDDNQDFIILPSDELKALKVEVDKEKVDKEDSPVYKFERECKVKILPSPNQSVSKKEYGILALTYQGNDSKTAILNFTKKLADEKEAANT